MDFTQRVRKEITSSDYLSANVDIIANVPSDVCTGEGNSMGLSYASIEDRKFIFPSGDVDGSQLLAHCRRGCGVIKVTRNQVLYFLLALLSPLWVDREIYECPTPFSRGPD